MTPPTRLLYRDDPYQLEFVASVVERREHEGQPAVVLDQTAFYALSGGQPWDLGTLDGVPVTAVLHDGDAVLHVLQASLPGGTRVSGRVDGARRQDHLQQHHGQHLLSRAFIDVAGARTTSFHLGSAHCTIDLDRDVGASQATAAQARVNEVIWSARPVSVRMVSSREAQSLGVTPPADAGDAVRLVDVSGYDIQPCSGTHPRNTSEVGVVLLLGIERHKAGCRVSFVCGQRALLAWDSRRAVLDRMGALLSVPIAELAQAAQRLTVQLDDATRRARALQEQALEQDARALGGSGEAGAVIVARRDGASPVDLRTIAVAAAAVRGATVLLGAVTDGRAYLAFAQQGQAHDMGRVLREAVVLLGGRGGGSASLAQGGGDRVDQLDAALSAAAAALGAR